MKWKCSVQSYKPSFGSEVLESKFHSECDRLGISISTLDGQGDNLSADAIEALQYILASKQIPFDLEQRLLKAKKSENLHTVTDFTKDNIDDFFEI